MINTFRFFLQARKSSSCRRISKRRLNDFSWSSEYFNRVRRRSKSINHKKYWWYSIHKTPRKAEIKIIWLPCLCQGPEQVFPDSSLTLTKFNFFFDEKTLLAYCLKYWYITWYKLALPNWTLAPSTLVAAWSTLASIESEIKPIKL